MVRTATGYSPTGETVTTHSVDERDRFLIKVEIFERDQQFRAYAGEMNLHKDAVVLVVERGPE
jgi:hypothetical protein